VAATIAGVDPLPRPLELPSVAEPAITLGSRTPALRDDGSFMAKSGGEEACRSAVATTPCHAVTEPVPASAVPEASTIGMMIVGLGIVLGGLYPGGRHRRRRPAGSNVADTTADIAADIAADMASHSAHSEVARRSGSRRA
jgi:hypothetical protein